MTKEDAIKELEEYLQDADKASSEDEEYIRCWKSAFLIALEITNEIDGKSATPDKQEEIKQETTFTSKSGKYAPDPRELLECHNAQKNLVSKWRGTNVTCEPDGRVIFHFNNTTEAVDFMRTLEAKWR